MRLGSINPCGTATLYDSRNRRIARTLDTPNSLAVAFREFPNAIYALAFYPGSKPERRERAEYVTRYVDTETEKLLSRDIIAC